MIERKMRHPNNPVLNWNMANAVATMDPGGNRKLDKDKGLAAQSMADFAEHHSLDV